MSKTFARCFLASAAVALLTASCFVHVHTANAFPLGGHNPLLIVLAAECVGFGIVITIVVVFVVEVFMVAFGDD